MTNEPIKMEVSQQQLEKELQRVAQLHKRKSVIKSIILWTMIAAACIITVSLLWFPIVWIEDTGQIVLTQRSDEFFHEEFVVWDSGNGAAIFTVTGTAGELIIRDELGNLIHNGEVMTGENIPDHLTTVPEDHVLLRDKAESRIYCVACEEIIGRVIFPIWPLPCTE